MVEVQNSQFAAVLLLIWQKLCTFLGQDWAALLPEFPGLAGIKISDFIAGNYDKIKTAVIAALATNSIPFPSPIFGTISAYAIELAHVIQSVYVSSVKLLFDFVVAKIQPVIDLIQSTFHAGINAPSFPTMPTFTEIKAKLSEAFSYGSTSFTFPNFPSIPMPNWGSIVAPAMQIVKELPKIFLELFASLLKTLKDFVSSITNYIGAITWPKLCVSEFGITIG
jgi:hypothetical protein